MQHHRWSMADSYAHQSVGTSRDWNNFRPRSGDRGYKCRFLITLGSFIIAIMIAGCEQTPPTSSGPLYSSSGTVETTDHLQMALQRLRGVQTFQTAPAHRQAAFHLNQWMSLQKQKPAWQLDSLFMELPERFDGLKGRDKSGDNLSRLTFDLFDVSVLQEAIWLRDTAQRVIAEAALDPSVSRWRETIDISDAPEDRDALIAALQLFDWTVRNIQLDEASDLTPARAAERESAVAGAKQYPWEALIMGHADHYVRARLFMLLCRQIGIESVMLAVDDNLEDEPVPWVPGVLIGQDVYLFDSKLGLPIPGSDGNGIATLARARENPELFRQLDLGTGPRYAMRRSKLERLVALIDATPNYLSRRMKLVESRLRGHDRLYLTVPASDLATRLRQLAGIDQVSLWTAPYDVFLYKQSLGRNIEAARQAAMEYSQFQLFPPLSMGRVLHLQGVLTADAGGVSAASYYLQCQIPDWQLDELSDPEAKNMLEGIMGKLPEDPQQRSTFLSNLRATMTTVKQAASCWLGQLTYDNGDYEVASSYFRKLLDEYPDGKWKATAQYNLARSLEAIGTRDGDRSSLEQARDLYLADKNSPQQVGNHLRARLLAARIDELKTKQEK